MPENFRQAVGAIAGDARPGFTGTTCFSKPLEERDSYHYQAEYTVTQPVAAVVEQVRGAGVKHGWQPYRTRQGELLMVRQLDKRDVVVGVTADGRNTKVSAAMEFNCGGDDVADNPLYKAKLTAAPDLAPRQRQLLASAYEAVRETGIAIGPLLDPGKADPNRLPSPPPSSNADLTGCAADAGTGAMGAHWSGSGVGAPVSGFVTDTTDLAVVEERIKSVVGRRWEAKDHKRDDPKRVSYTVERDIGGVSARLFVLLERTEDHQGKPGVRVQGNLGTGCVPPSVG